MKILVTNDDGVEAPGLWKMVGAVKDLGEVVVAAPDRDQSGIGSARTLLDVVKVREVKDPPVEGVKTFAIEGTPADSAILGLEMLSPGKFDFMLSGINDGSNLGMDILVSGTVGAAIQGYYREMHSIAMSVASINNLRYDAAATTAASLVRTISADSGLPPLFLNVNVPNATTEGIKGAEVTKLGPRLYLENVERGTNGRRTYYWIKHNRMTNRPVSEDMDIFAVRNKRIAISAVNAVLEPDFDCPDLQPLADGVVTALGLANGIATI